MVGNFPILGINIAGMEEARLHGLFGVAFQSDAFFAGTIYENIDLGRGLPREAIEKAARCAQAEEFILTTPEGYEHPVRAKAVNLSGGQKKLLGIVCALMSDPRLLMLDEPTAGVHPNLRNDIVQSLRKLNEQGMTLVIVEHDMHFIREVCTRCIVLDRGRIVASCHPDELASNEHVVQAYLGGGEKRELAEVD